MDEQSALFAKGRLFIFFGAKKTNQKKTWPCLSSLKANGHMTPIHGLKVE